MNLHIKQQQHYIAVIHPLAIKNTQLCYIKYHVKTVMGDTIA